MDLDLITKLNKKNKREKKRNPHTQKRNCHRWLLVSENRLKKEEEVEE
jgi:hypothetical protein